MFFLDTNAVIHFFKDRGRVRERLLETPPHLLRLPSVALFELEAGVVQSNRPSQRRQQIDDFRSAVETVPFDDFAARKAAVISAELRKSGNLIGPIDTLIAGTALAHGATLVTHNTQEFQRVPGLKNRGLVLASRSSKRAASFP